MYHNHIALDDTANSLPSVNLARDAEIHERNEVLPAWDNSARRGRLTLKTMATINTDQTLQAMGEEIGAFGGSSMELTNEDNFKFMVHPNSIRHICWSLVGLILILYDCVMIPLEFLALPKSTGLITVTWFVRIYWTIGIIIAFRTGFLRPQGMVEMEPRAVAKMYATTWFPLDLLVVIIDWLEAIYANDDSVSDSFRNFGVLRAVRAIRLIRLFRAPELAGFVTEYIQSEQLNLLLQIARMIFLMLWVAHCVACVWYGIGEAGGINGWVRANGVNEMELAPRYIRCFHWSLSQFSGEAIFEPENDLERTFAVAVLFVFFVVAACFVSSITTSMTRLQLISSRQSSQFSVLRRYLRDHSISRKLASRIFRNAECAVAEQKRNAPESSVELLCLISAPLREELHYEIYSPTLMKHPFFMNYNHLHVAGMREICHQAITPLSLDRGEVLFQAGDVPNRAKMFFITSGILQYKREGSIGIVNVNSDGWLSEGALWTRWVHRGVVMALTDARLLALSSQKFQEVVSNFPTDNVPLYAAQFVDQLNSLREQDQPISDVGEVDDDLLDRVHYSFPEEYNEDEATEEESASKQLGSASLGLAWMQQSIRRTSVGSKASRDSSIVPVHRLSRCSEDSRGSRTSKTRRLSKGLIPKLSLW